MYDIGIHCGYLLPMQAGETEVLQQQFIGIKQGRIAVIKAWDIADRALSGKFIDASKQLVMPGLINGHTHLPMNLLRGLAEDKPFWEWLEGTILPVEREFVKPDFVRVGTQLALAELIQAGVTTVCDMYYFEDVVADTVDKIGLRAILAEHIGDWPAPDSPSDNGECYRIVERMAERYHNHPRITPFIAPHSPYACSDETLKKVLQFAERLSLPIKTHVAETKEEVQQSLEKYELTPVERLYQLGLMDQRSIFAHCVHVNERDMELIAKKGVGVIHNPNSNMKLSCGIAPLRAMKRYEINVGIGTDGAASNNRLNILNELATGMKLQKLNDADIDITSHDFVRMATIQGAKALGLEQQTGSLEIGKKADCIILDIDEPHWQPLYNIPAALVYSALGSEVVTTICHGQVLMENRKLKTIDMGLLRGEVDELSAKIQRHIQLA